MIKALTLLVPLLKRVLSTNKFTSIGAIMALGAVVLLKLHDISTADFLAVLGLAVTVIGFASKDGVRSDSPVAPENITPGPDVPPFGPGTLGVLLLGLLLATSSCASQLPPALEAAPRSMLASQPAAVSNDSLEATPDSLQVPPYLVAPPKDLTKRQVRQFRRAQRRALIEASRVVPAKLKVQRGSAYNAAPDGTAVALHKPDAAVAVGPGAHPTDNRNVGRNANGGVSAGGHDAAPATGATAPPKPGLLARIWSGVKEYGLMAVVLAFVVGIVWVRFSPFGVGLRAAAAASRLASKL